MTDDIIERAEALNPDNYYAWRDSKATMFPDLLAALKTARARITELEDRLWGYEHGVSEAPKAWDGKEPWPGDAVREAWK